MLRNHIFWLQPARCGSAIAIGVGVGHDDLRSSRRSGLNEGLQAARESARAVYVTAEPSGAERITCEGLERNNSLQLGIEPGGSQQHAVAREPLIDTRVDADGLFRSQRWVAKPNQPQTLKGSSSE